MLLFPVVLIYTDEPRHLLCVDVAWSHHIPDEYKKKTGSEHGRRIIPSWQVPKKGSIAIQPKKEGSIAVSTVPYRIDPTDPFCAQAAR